MTHEMLQDVVVNIFIIVQVHPTSTATDVDVQGFFVTDPNEQSNSPSILKMPQSPGLKVFEKGKLERRLPRKLPPRTDSSSRYARSHTMFLV